MQQNTDDSVVFITVKGFMQMFVVKSKVAQHVKSPFPHFESDTKASLKVLRIPEQVADNSNNPDIN